MGTRQVPDRDCNGAGGRSERVRSFAVELNRTGSHGKTITITQTGTNAKGEAVNNTIVYTRQ